MRGGTISEHSNTDHSQASGPHGADTDLLFAFLNELAIITQLSGTRFRRRLPDDLTPSQFFVLNNFVRLGGERTPAQLAAAFEVTRGAMTNTLNRLEARGCVEMREDPADGRSKIVSITPAGRNLREKAIDATRADLERMAAAFDMTGIAGMLEGVRDIRAWLDNNRD